MRNAQHWSLRRRAQARLAFAAFVALAQISSAVPVAAEDASPSPSQTPQAGVSMLVFPGELEDPSGRNRFTELDFVLEGGQVADRLLRIQGSRDGGSTISIKVLDARIVNDKVELVNRLSPVTSWVTFTRNNFTVAAGEVAEVGMQISPPVDAGNSLNYAFVVVKSELVNPPQAGSSPGGAVVGAAAQYAMGLTAITGDAEFVRVKFEIADVGGVLVGDQKFLRVFIDNQSQFPIAPIISVQLVSADFTTLRFGPFEGQAPAIPKQTKRAIDIPISNQVSDGNYRILVEATEGINTQRREFEKALVFEDADYSDFVFPWYEVILGALALGFVILLLLLMRSNRKARQALQRATVSQESSPSPDWPDQPPRQS